MILTIGSFELETFGSSALYVQAGERSAFFERSGVRLVQVVLGNKAIR